MKTSSKNSWIPILIWVSVVLLLAILLYHIFRTEGLKNYKTNMENEFDRLKRQIKEKEKNVAFLEGEFERLSTLKSCIIDYGLRLYKTIKLTLLFIVIGVGLISYTLFNFDFIGNVLVILPVLTVSYYAITITVKNRIGDLNRSLRFIQNHFVDAVLKFKGFDVSLLEEVKEQLIIERGELEELRRQLADCENKVSYIIVETDKNS